MCDTFAAIEETSGGRVVWFGKNSDREPGEEQKVEVIEGGQQKSSRLQCTYLNIPQVARVSAVIVSRPSWMWGAEMGANEHGVVIGNEAVFTKIPYAKTGLTGMDLLRLALERSSTAAEAVEVITRCLDEFGQGGGCGYRNRNFRYHNAFLIADPEEAWVLETADRYWALERVGARRTISNQLSIGRDYERLAPGTIDYAVKQGWHAVRAEFDFGRAFRDEKYSRMSGAGERAECTALAISKSPFSLASCFSALRDHNGLDPSAGWRMRMPCAHSSWWPTRRAEQTTGSMVSRIERGTASHYLTGTSSPCLSVFKRVDFNFNPNFNQGEGLFWAHEKLHRLVLGNYAVRSEAIAGERMNLERKAVDPQVAWSEHLDAIPRWLSQAAQFPSKTGLSQLAFNRYWKQQDLLDSSRLEGC